MAFPLRPGVTFNESLTPLAQVDQSSGRLSAVFVGTNAGGGPTDPTPVTSWAQFAQSYGGFGNGGDLLPFAVYEFFNNGGGQCYVIRAVKPTAAAATKVLNDTETTPKPALLVSAKAPGIYGNSLSVTVAAGSTADKVNFSVTNTTTNQTEVYNDVTLDPASTRNILSVVNGGSALVTVSVATGAATGTFLPSFNPAVQSGTSLTGGTEGTGTVDLVAATQKLATVPGTFDVNLPGVNDAATINSLSSWAVDRGNVFLVVDGVAGAASDTAAQNATAQRALVAGGGITASSTVAVYGPWQQANDPISAVAGSPRLLPPGGFVLGQYARTDVTRGVQKVAAGITNSLRGVLGPQFVYAPTDLDSLNQSGINVIKTVPGAGTCIFGARTLSLGMPDRYINIRRTLITLKDGLTSLTRFAIFESNDDVLRQQITDLAEQYLRTQWAAGLLAGQSEGDAFFVVCDDTNNSPASIAQGQVAIQIGVALQTPAEFIVFNIGQTASGSTVTAA